MKAIAAALLVLVMSARAAPAVADQAFKDDFALAETVAPGSPVSLRGDWTPEQNAVDVYLRAANTSTDIAAGRTELVNGALKFTVPANLNPGRYTVRIGSQKLLAPGTLDVAVPVVTLDTINPATSYQGSTGKFDFTLVGEHFATDPCFDDVVVQGQDSIVKFRAQSADECGADPGQPAKAIQCAAGTPGAAASASRADGTCLWVESSRLLHIVGYPSARYQGSMMVGVRVGNAKSEQRTLVLARRSERAILVFSAGAILLLFAFVWWTVSGGLARNKVGSRRLGLFQTFIFDPESNTYSLSKFQLLLFTVTFVFGYLYIFFANWLVQWRFALPDVPQNIAGLLGMSGGTTIAAAGLTAARGSKGAGLQRPTGADLISNGGVVVGERFQFFVWTIVSCAGFMMLLISQDPARVNAFPQIPDGLLYVMGISAAAYLGGKAARKPGPIIQNIAVDPKGNKTGDGKDLPVLMLQGQNLASDGRYFVDGKELPIVSDSEKKAAKLPEKLIEATPQLDASDTNFCTELKITIASNTVDVTTAEHRFRVVNRDGQFADMSFSAMQPKITAVYAQDTTPPDPTTRRLPAGGSTITVTVTGENLRVGTTVTWKPQAATEPGDVSIAAHNSETEMRLSLVPGKPGTGILTLMTPSGFVTTASVVVDGSSGTGGGSAPPSTPTTTTTAAGAPAAPVSPPATPTPAAGSTTSASSAPPTDQVVAPASPPGEGGSAHGPDGTGGGGSPAPAGGPNLEGGSS